MPYSYHDRGHFDVILRDREARTAERSGGAAAEVREVGQIVAIRTFDGMSEEEEEEEEEGSDQSDIEFLPLWRLNV